MDEVSWHFCKKWHQKTKTNSYRMLLYCLQIYGENIVEEINLLGNFHVVLVLELRNQPTFQKDKPWLAPNIGRQISDFWFTINGIEFLNKSLYKGLVFPLKYCLFLSQIQAHF